MKEKKYILTDETIEFEGHTLHRIQAVRDFNNIEAGDKGGFIEKEENLSHDGDCWVCGDAKVFDNARVYSNARICGEAIMFDNARIYGRARVFDCAKVYNEAQVYDYAFVCNDAKIYDKAEIKGAAQICDNAKVYGRAWVCDDVMVLSNARVYDDSCICDNVVIGGGARVCGCFKVGGRATIYANAIIRNPKDYIVFKNWWSSGRFFTWTRSNNMWSVGCFYGTGEKLIQKAYKDSELSGREYERVVKYVESILADEEKENNQLKQNEYGRKND